VVVILAVMVGDVFGPVLFVVGVREVVECEVVSRSGAPFRAISWSNVDKGTMQQ